MGATVNRADATRDEQIALEQAFVNRAYRELDSQRKRYRDNQRIAHAAQWRDTPQALTERDALSAHWGDEAQRLENVGERLVFGRIDTTDDDTLYVGRIGLRDSSGDQFLIDWRAPAARPFYQATGANPEGVRRRRHIQTRLREVVGIEDELLDASSPAEGLVFQGEGALMAALTEARDGRMGDIVATIQREQDEVIRRNGDGLIVIQGGPGTGKTAVALHRAAYLLYAERGRLENSGVLILGPSRVFLNYIDQVLPSLGETGVVSTTVADLLPGYQASARDNDYLRDLKGRLDWADIAARAVRSFERVGEDVELLIGGVKVTLQAADVAAARAHARRSGRPHNEAWEGFALELMGQLAKQLDEASAEGHDEEWYFDSIRTSLPAQRAINLRWLPVCAGYVLRKLYSNAEFLRQCAPHFNEDELAALARPPHAPWTESDIPILDELEERLGKLPSARSSERTRRKLEEREVDAAAAAIDALDLGGGLVSAQMLAQRARGEEGETTLAQRALRDRTWAYGHVIVDEAQELSPLAWQMLLRRCPSRSFTVTGDLDQFSGSAPKRSWEEVLGPAQRALVAKTVLTVSYRTPGALLRRAEAYLRERDLAPAYPLVAAREAEDTYQFSAVPRPDAGCYADSIEAAVAAELAHLDARVGEDLGRLAVIAPTGLVRELASLEGSVWARAHAQSLTDRVVYLTPAAAKGLEFDVAIVVDPVSMGREHPGDVYVAMTRPTQRLHVLAHGEVPTSLLP